MHTFKIGVGKSKESVLAQMVPRAKDGAYLLHSWGIRTLGIQLVCCFVLF